MESLLLPLLREVWRQTIVQKQVKQHDSTPAQHIRARNPNRLPTRISGNECHCPELNTLIIKLNTFFEDFLSFVASVMSTPYIYIYIWNEDFHRIAYNRVTPTLIDLICRKSPRTRSTESMGRGKARSAWVGTCFGTKPVKRLLAMTVAGIFLFTDNH